MRRGRAPEELRAREVVSRWDVDGGPSPCHSQGQRVFWKTLLERVSISVRACRWMGSEFRRPVREALSAKNSCRVRASAKSPKLKRQAERSTARHTRGILRSAVRLRINAHASTSKLRAGEENLKLHKAPSVLALPQPRSNFHTRWSRILERQTCPLNYWTRYITSQRCSKRSITTSELGVSATRRRDEWDKLQRDPARAHNELHAGVPWFALANPPPQDTNIETASQRTLSPAQTTSPPQAFASRYFHLGEFLHFRGIYHGFTLQDSG